MTLTRLLEINRSLLDDLELRGLEFAEREWLAMGVPIEPALLCGALETILQRSVAEGVGYPRVLLLRKKQLQRRTWAPPHRSSPPSKAGSSASGEPSCPNCGGIGVATNPGGLSGRLCECGAWKKPAMVGAAT
jgi:hypothetical protein